jgi:hypothetical protein
VGNPVGVLVPIDLSREIASERETGYLLRRDAARQRLLDAKNRTESVSLEDACAEFGI